MGKRANDEAAAAADMISPAASGTRPAPSENDVSANTAAASSQRTAGRLNDQMFLRCLISFLLLFLFFRLLFRSSAFFRYLREVSVNRLIMLSALREPGEL